MRLTNLTANAPMRTAAVPAELAGMPVGDDLVLPSGVRIRIHELGDRAVTRDAVRVAVRGVLQLPESHQRLIAALRIPIELIPVSELEDLPGTTEPVVGATRVVGPDGSVRAERVRIASYQHEHGTSIEECVQHELGHVVGVTSRQDLTEDFAVAYAQRY